MPPGLAHAQFGSNYVAAWNVSGQLKLRNVLIHDGTYAITATGVTNGNQGEHVTFHRLSYLRSSGTTALTNSLIISVTNNVNYYGSNNATNLDDTGFFQTVGRGAHYLAAGSTNRNAGTTNINATLLADLKQRTTYPPAVLSTNVPGDADTPDLSYHYDILDSLVTGIVVTNDATVVVTGGAAIGFDFSGPAYGIKPDTGTALISEGSPLNLNRFVRSHAVQELPGTNANPTFADTDPGYSMTLRFRFTDLPMLSGDYYHFYQYNNHGALSELVLQDCRLRGGKIYVSPNNPAQTINWTNNLFDRVDTTLYPYANFTMQARNNLFREGKFSFGTGNSTNYTFKDNLFDKTTIYLDPYLSFSNDFNAYVTTNYGRLRPEGSNDVILTTTNLDYQAGALGNYYYPTNGGLLSQLLSGLDSWASVGEGRTAEKPGIAAGKLKSKNVMTTSSAKFCSALNHFSKNSTGHSCVRT